MRRMHQQPEKIENYRERNSLSRRVFGRREKAQGTRLPLACSMSPCPTLSGDVCALTRSGVPQKTASYCELMAPESRGDPTRGNLAPANDEADVGILPSFGVEYERDIERKGSFNAATRLIASWPNTEAQLHQARNLLGKAEVDVDDRYSAT